MPLKKVPSPKEGYPNYADYFAADFGEVLRELGVSCEFLSSFEMYKKGDFDGVIREALEMADKIQDIYKQVSGSKKREMGWLPFQVVCENCGKLGTTRVHGWDGKTVAYTCEKSLVKWAEGCGFEGRIPPFGGTGKLPWKVDWPAHWKVLGITIEGAGKDHSSAGGSRDIAAVLCKQVFHIENPYNLPYEFFLLGGRKMSTSKGIGLKARDIKELLPASVARFLFCRTDYRQTVEFEPIGTMAIPDLFDEYDRCFKAYVEGSDENLSRAFEMAQIGEIPHKKETFLPRFRDVAAYIQMPNVDILNKYEEIKGKKLSELEIKIINERAKYAKIWLEKYAPDEFKLSLSEILPEKAKELSVEQKQFL
ncbi:MAG: lysine--tRNA ligase, partial [Candidatus Daviesbacteria bacterium]|nr:lysine--tRNA ligase [Candidatus Daviesbacteria bacterium]